jgi:hypothetical protein
MSSKDVERITAFSKQVYEAAETAVGVMQDGERIQIKQLAQAVGSALSEDPKKVLGLVNLYAHDTSIAYVTRGKNGGIVKGTRPVKIVKPAKKVKVDTVTVATTDNS